MTLELCELSVFYFVFLVLKNNSLIEQISKDFILPLDGLLLCGLKNLNTKGTKILHEGHKRHYSTLCPFFTLRLCGSNKIGSLMEQICTDVYSFVMLCNVTVQIKYLP